MNPVHQKFPAGLRNSLKPSEVNLLFSYKHILKVVKLFHGLAGNFSWTVDQWLKTTELPSILAEKKNYIIHCSIDSKSFRCLYSESMSSCSYIYAYDHHGQHDHKLPNLRILADEDNVQVNFCIFFK